MNYCNGTGVRTRSDTRVIKSKKPFKGQNDKGNNKRILGKLEVIATKLATAEEKANQGQFLAAYDLTLDIVNKHPGKNISDQALGKATKGTEFSPHELSYQSLAGRMNLYYQKGMAFGR